MKKRLTRVLYYIVMCVTMYFCQNSTGYAHEEKSPFRVIGYYRGDISEVEKFDYEKLTHLIYCFMFLHGNQIGFKNEDSKNTLLRCLTLKKRHPHLKVLVALGGWGGCETCSDVFSTEIGRKEFALSVASLLEQYSIDGIDIDWESPVIGGYNNHKASEADKDNFTAMIQELRSALPDDKEICFDANSFKEFINRSIDWNNVMPYVNFVNLMTYGLPSNKRGHTGHHSALCSSPFQYESIDLAIQRLDSLNIPKNKIVIGAAFYSFVVGEIDSIMNGLGRKGKFISNMTYKELSEQYTESQGYEYHWDNTAKAPFLYNKTKKIFVTYDDKTSVTLKTEYAIKNRLGGIMFWKLNGDRYTNGLLDAIHTTISVKR